MDIFINDIYGSVDGKNYSNTFYGIEIEMPCADDIIRNAVDLMDGSPIVIDIIHGETGKHLIGFHLGYQSAISLKHRLDEALAIINAGLLMKEKNWKSI